MQVSQNLTVATRSQQLSSVRTSARCHVASLHGLRSDHRSSPARASIGAPLVGWRGLAAQASASSLHRARCQPGGRPSGTGPKRLPQAIDSGHASAGWPHRWLGHALATWHNSLQWQSALFAAAERSLQFNKQNQQTTQPGILIVLVLCTRLNRGGPDGVQFEEGEPSAATLAEPAGRTRLNCCAASVSRRSSQEPTSMLAGAIKTRHISSFAIPG